MKEFKETLQIREILSKGEDGSFAWLRGGALSAGGLYAGDGEGKEKVLDAKSWKITDRANLDTLT